MDLRHVHRGLWESVEGGLETGSIVDDRADPAHWVTVEAVLVATGLDHWQLLRPPVNVSTAPAADCGGTQWSYPGRRQDLAPEKPGAWCAAITPGWPVAPPASARWPRASPTGWGELKAN